MAAGWASDLEVERMLSISSHNWKELHYLTQETHGSVWVSTTWTENGFGNSQAERLMRSRALGAIPALITTSQKWVSAIISIILRPVLVVA
jgi:hypothetical protein